MKDKKQTDSGGQVSKDRLGMIREFKEFALKGNAITLAIGVVMGAAFNSIVKAMVDNLFTPLLGVLTGGIDFAKKTSIIFGVEFGWGAVIGAVINFLVIAFSLFIAVKFISRLSKEPDPTTHPCPYCTTEIANEATRCPACTSQVDPVLPAADAIV